MNEIEQEQLKEQLCDAISEGDADKVRELIARGANVMYTHEWTPLHLAVEFGKIEIVNALIEEGANVNAVLYFHGTPLCIAAERGDTDIMNALIKAGANVNFQGTYNTITSRKAKMCVNYQDISNLTPLHIATKEGHKDAVKVLLEAGAYTDKKDARSMTSLDWAVKKGYTECSKILIKRAVLRDSELGKPKSLSGELSEYWDNQVKKDTFFCNNKGIFYQMFKHSGYIINRNASLDNLISDAENFLKKTQEKSDTKIDFNGMIEYRVDRRYPASLKAAAFGNYKEGVSRMLSDPNANQPKVGPVIN